MASIDQKKALRILLQAKLWYFYVQNDALVSTMFIQVLNYAHLFYQNSILLIVIAFLESDILMAKKKHMNVQNKIESVFKL